MASIDDAVDFMHLCGDADSENRNDAVQDLKFRYGDQWPSYAIASRGLDRPKLTINAIDSFIRQVTSGQRQQRPRIKVHPCGDNADPKIAQLKTGLIRHIETASDADNAYDIAFDFAATIGWGYWRIGYDYVSDTSFDQDIVIKSIDNPFSVYFDPASVAPDGSDASKCLIVGTMRKDDFERDYPGADVVGFDNNDTGDYNPSWAEASDIRIAEYIFVDRKPADLLKLSNGAIIYGDQLKRYGDISAYGVRIVSERKSYRTAVKWRKQSGAEILEEQDLPGKWIPVIPVYWTNTRIEDKRLRHGLVRPGMDAQRMINFWQTAITESLALAPKAKWLVAEGADEGHENEFKHANLSSTSVLRYKPTGIDGTLVPPPQRIQPELPPSGAIEAAFLANQNLSRVLGVFDPGVRSGAQHKSGKTLDSERGQSESSNYHGYDNLTRSIKHTGRIILSYIPEIYNYERVQRIIGDDGRPDLVVINQKKQDVIGVVLNDLSPGEYDVVMDVGPGYDTKRQEGVDAILQLMSTAIGEKVAQVGDDLLVRHMDFPGADVLADRLAASNPLSKIDEKSDVPPHVQMMMQSLRAQLQQATQKIQDLEIDAKYRASIEQMKQAGETQREHMRAAVKAHDTETWAAENISQTRMQTEASIHDTNSRVFSAQHVAEINGMIALQIEKMKIINQKSEE